MSVTSFQVAADHPAARGHFPGNPIVPGAVLLSAVVQAIEDAVDAPCLPCRIRSVKFFRPVRPGDRVTVEYSRPTDMEIRFGGSVEGKTVLTGHLQCHPEPQGA